MQYNLNTSLTKALNYISVFFVKKMPHKVNKFDSAEKILVVLFYKGVEI